MTTTSTHPTEDTARIDSLDALRGVAILGILLMNVIGMGLPNAYFDPSIAGGATGADIGAWVATSGLFEGTMRGLFTLLFGAGVVLFTDRAERTSPTIAADLHVRRMLWLVAFGFVNSHVLLWVGDILYEYGIVGLVLYAFRKARPRTLLVTSVVLLAFITGRGWLDVRKAEQLHADAGVAAAIQASGKPLTKEQQQAIDDWKEKLQELKPPPEKVAKHVDAMRGGYVTVWKRVTDTLVGLRTTFFYEFGFLEDLATMMIGVALFTLGALQGRWSALQYALLMLGGYAFGLSVRAAEIAWMLRAQFDPLVMLWTENVVYQLGRVPMTLGHAGLVLLVWKSGVASGALRRLSCVGRMAFSNYLAQSAIGMLVFTGVGLELFGKLQRHELYYVVVAIWVAQLVWSPWWLARFRYGPAEWLWRSLTYREWQGFRRKAASGTAAAMS